MLSVLAVAALLQPIPAVSFQGRHPYAADLIQDETFAFAREKLRSLAAIDLWQGRARLADGQCLVLNVVDSTSRQPIVSGAPDACAYVSATTGIPAVRCGELDRLVAAWRVGCRSAKSTQELIAVHPQSGDTILLAVPDHELLFVSAFGLHDRIMIRTLALRTDGKAVISSYHWNPRPL